jgi:hypothetical protein
MAISKKEIALTLATAVIAIFLLTIVTGISTGFMYGDIKMSQDQFNQIWQFGTIFGGAALFYFGFRAGQSNGSAVAQA